MQHPDEGMIHTWLDGELSAEESSALEAHSSECSECATAIAEARGLVAASSRIVGLLDAVPGGVIPAWPKPRMWYASTQFRAAAAILVVAGASLLVTRTGTERTTETASGRPLVGAVSKMEEPVRTGAATNVTGKIETPPLAAKGAASRKATAREQPAMDKAFSGRGVSAFPAPSVAATLPEAELRAADAISPQSRAPAETGFSLRLLRMDSTETTKRSFYETSPGMQVILTELDPASFMAKAMAQTPNRREAASLRALQVPGVTGAAPSREREALKPQTVNTINWVDSLTRHQYSLTGPLSVEELTALKGRLLHTKR